MISGDCESLKAVDTLDVSTNVAHRCWPEYQLYSTGSARWKFSNESQPGFETGGIRLYSQCIRGPEQKILLDSATTQYLNSSAPQPTQAALDSVMDQVRAVRVFNNGSHDGKILGNDVALEVSEPADVAALRATMRILDGPGGHCMCIGGPTLELMSADGSRLAVLSIHHGLAIRWNRWKDDAKLVDGRLLLDWLAERGVAKPLREFEAMEQRQRESKQHRNRWLAAMPNALVPVWSSALGNFGIVNVDALRARLETALPDEAERVLALLEWFGSGAGPWSGHPSYETAAETLLLEYSTARVIKVIESARLSPAQLEGAARLFAGWSFSQQRPNDLMELPGPLKTALWEHVKDTRDPDKRSRATRAFVDSAQR
jgi:hypothetical protein